MEKLDYLAYYLSGMKHKFCYPDKLSAILEQRIKRVTLVAASVRVALGTMREQANAPSIPR